MSSGLSIGIDFVGIACTLFYIAYLVRSLLPQSSDGTPVVVHSSFALVSGGSRIEKRSLLGQVVVSRA